MRISDWSSDVCSSDLVGIAGFQRHHVEAVGGHVVGQHPALAIQDQAAPRQHRAQAEAVGFGLGGVVGVVDHLQLEVPAAEPEQRSEEHTSELQSLMRISYVGLCSKKKT